MMLKIRDYKSAIQVKTQLISLVDIEIQERLQVLYNRLERNKKLETETQEYNFTVALEEIDYICKNVEVK